MPSGWIHSQISLAAAAITYTYGLKSGDSPTLAAAAAVGCAAGVVLTPDLDVVGIYADKRIREKAGLAVAVLWAIIWRPYSWLIPHRSILSHGLILGTVLRLAYLALPLWIVGLLPGYTPTMARLIAGLLISDNLHVGADFLVTGIKTIYVKDRKANH